MAKQEMKFSKLQEHRTARDSRPAPQVQDPMVLDPTMLALKSIASICNTTTFIKFILLTQEVHESSKSRSLEFSTGPVALVDIQLIDHATLALGYTTIIKSYETCYLRENSTRQMRLMLVPMWSLREVQDELAVIPGHLSLGFTLTRTGLQISGVLHIQAPVADRMPGLDSTGNGGGNSNDLSLLLAPA